jgi:hypothetical protein
MTANPNWPEIQEALLEYQGNPGNDPTNPPRYQTTADRPAIVAQVFKLKKDALLKEIKDGLFGELAKSVYTIEYHKCGLPHMHLLIFLKDPYKIRDAPHVDHIVSAQIPDPITQPLLHKTVTTCMLHGPCGPEYPNTPCMVDGKCSKHYPKEFNPETQFGEDGYLQYARPDNGQTFTNQKGHVFDSCDVVPYSQYLCVKYDCHINVEICASIKAIKYIHKYVYSGGRRG